MEFFHLLFEIILLFLEKYIRDFQIFITIVIKPIMDFFHFLFATLLFLVEKYKKHVQIFTTTMIKPFIDLLKK
jgi:hypothetical protein